MARCLKLRHNDCMDFDAAIKSAGSQFAVVAAAPIPFVISLAILIVAIWQVCRWYYDGRISSLEGRLAFKADEVATLRQSVAELETERARKPHDPRQAIEAASPARKEPSQEDLALVKMAKTLQDAETEQVLANGRFTNRNVPALKASILTASKVFGITEPYPTPENYGGPLTLGAGISLLRQVLPLLQDGHLDEAKRISQRMYDAEADRLSKIVQNQN